MNSKNPEKHKTQAPNLRQIRRACNKELYRTAKRIGHYIAPEKIEEAEKLYYKQVLSHLPFIVENSSNRKELANWWETNVAPDIAAIWEVEVDVLSRKFREAFGG
ncbi:dehydrogenase [Paenibacillus sp. N1-5-1-14]|uniref:dehydrogenase n=1 Tax=Paenibacillus radicibacter TaxID=2972488 RepID=UPI0021590C2A|nr:dehydrogenase [Paenibacillus radicibacter]MCR8644727.1 dehydrogenase [Paenibacillus radicibacter]